MSHSPHVAAGRVAGARDPHELTDWIRGFADAGPFSPLRHVRTLPARDGEQIALPDWVEPSLMAALAQRGVTRLWSHQALAAEEIRQCRNTAIATGTASGKSLGYLLPGLTSVIEGTRAPNGRGATMLYVAPTKALAADQAAHIEALQLPGVRCATYDGDTPPDERRWIRDHANVVLTNPDLVHHSLLPGHARWASFLRALRLVVIDESHAYRGVFGSNVALVLRRLRRVLARYRADPVFVFASATAGEPGTHARALAGLPVTEITQDGSPRGAVTFALWEPRPNAGEDGAPRRPAAGTEAARLLAALVAAQIQTLTFARSRAGVEAVASAANRHLQALGSSERVAAYRGGYLPEERRALEAALRTGELRGLAATNALELGIDIQGLDAVVMAGWPGRLSSLWQQAGRAGRGGQASLAVLIGADDPLDAYLMEHPELIFEAPIEATVIHPDNPRLLARHLLAAAHELPVTEADTALFGPGMLPALAGLEAAGAVRRRPAGWFWPHDGRPEGIGSLRTAGEVLAIVEEASGRVVGTIDDASADHHVHPGAVHVHQGRSFVVTDLDRAAATATVVPGDPGWSTIAQSRSEFDLATPDAVQLAAAVTVCRGAVTVRTQVVSFTRRLPGGEVLGRHPLELPERTFTTEGLWWHLPEAVLHASGLSGPRIAGSVHAAEHAAIGMLSLFATCDRWDIGGVSSAAHPATGEPTILIYDGYPGGAGYAARGFEVLPAWLAATRELIAGCPCERGCPRCVVSPKCGNGNEPLDKEGAGIVLAVIGAALAAAT